MRTDLKNFRSAAVRLAAALFLILGCNAFPVAALASELLLNRSFEDPVVPAEGNNFYATIADWTVQDVVPATSMPFNVIRPGPGYANNPGATPAGGGIQYLDINSASGVLHQTVTVTALGMVTIRGWFSVRDYQQTLGGMTVQLRDVSSNAIVGSASVSFDATEPIGLWKEAVALNLPVTAGAYVFEVVIPNNANFDLASAVYAPALSVTKSSTAYQDPVYGTTNPKLIPGGVAAYTIAVSSPADYTVSSNTLSIVDATPAGMALVVADTGGPSSGPVSFTGGSSALTLGYSGLSSNADNIDFSADHGFSWTYAPSPGSNGSDPAVTNVRVRPQGAMAPSSTFSIGLRYVIQ